MSNEAKPFTGTERVVNLLVWMPICVGSLVIASLPVAAVISFLSTHLRWV